MLEQTFLLDQLTDLPADEVGLAVLGYPIAHPSNRHCATAARAAPPAPNTNTSNSSTDR